MGVVIVSTPSPRHGVAWRLCRRPAALLLRDQCEEDRDIMEAPEPGLSITSCNTRGKRLKRRGNWRQ